MKPLGEQKVFSLWVRIFRKSAFFEESLPGKRKSDFSFSVPQSLFELNEKTKESPPSHQRFPIAKFPPNCMKINRTRVYDIHHRSWPHRAKEDATRKQTLSGKIELPSKAIGTALGVLRREMLFTQLPRVCRDRQRAGAAFVDGCHQAVTVGITAT